MLQLPISEIVDLLSSISFSIQDELDKALHYKLTGSVLLLVSNIRVITLTPDWIKDSPLVICTVGCDLKEVPGYEHDRGYYACLIDLLRFRVVGIAVRVKPSASGEVPFYLTPYIVGSFRTVINLKPYYGCSVGMLSSGGFEVGEFVNPLVVRYKKGCGITLYEDWLLEFLSKRQAFLMLLETSKSYLIGTMNYIEEYRLRMDTLVDELKESIKNLIDNYQ